MGQVHRVIPGAAAGAVNLGAAVYAGEAVAESRAVKHTRRSIEEIAGGALAGGPTQSHARVAGGAGGA